MEISETILFNLQTEVNITLFTFPVCLPLAFFHKTPTLVLLIDAHWDMTHIIVPRVDWHLLCLCCILSVGTHHVPISMKKISRS